MQKTILTILSTNYAGSHFLSLLLGSNSRSKHLGEVKVLRIPNPEGEHPGEQGLELVRGKVLEGIGPENIDQVYDLVFSRLDPSVRVLVDASKKPRWAERFLHRRDLDLKYVHLIRDPRAIVRRDLMRSRFFRQLRRRWWVFRDLPELRASIFFAPEPLVWTYVWLQRNWAITRFLEQHRLAHTLVTYRDLAMNPAAEVARLMEFCGLTFEPAQLEYWNFDHVGTQKRGYQWVKERKQSNHIDLRWRTELPEAVQRRIAADPHVNRYLSRIGVRITDEGLTRAPA
ncbi:MAG TPA: sulfotransferase domain-containing protein [Methylomirabilota bacterium]|nr:sulfotransferase domain-containing protein [Methylomirabilota bacterium]